MSNSRRRLTAWTAAGLLGTGALAGAVVSQVGFASADTPAPAPGGTAASQAPGPLAGHPGIRGALRDMFGAGDLGRPLCGDITVKAPKSSTATLAVHFQNGKLGDVSGNTFSVTSEGCPTGSYAVVDGTTKIIKDGAAVSLSQLDTGKPVHVVSVGDTLRLVVQGRPAHGPRGDVKPGTVSGGSLTVDGNTVTVPGDAKFFKDGKEVGSLSALSGNVHVLYGPDGKVKAVVEGQRPPRPGPGPGQRGPGHGRMGGPGWMGPQNGTPPSGTASSNSQTF